MASGTGVAGQTRGIGSPVRMRFPTDCNIRPRLPPKWSRAKSSAVEPRRLSKAIARASPKAIVAVHTQLLPDCGFLAQTALSLCLQVIWRADHRTYSTPRQYGLTWTNPVVLPTGGTMQRRRSYTLAPSAKQPRCGLIGAGWRLLSPAEAGSQQEASQLKSQAKRTEDGIEEDQG